MKKTLKSLIMAGASLISTGAFASSNVENPLYMPKDGEAYLKAGAAIMYKTSEKTKATEEKGIDGDAEFPVWRFTGDMGYGITDRLDIHGRFGYTKDGDIDRKGMHRGKLGLMFRALTEDYPLVLDLYADAYLSGITPMKAEYTTKGFNFKNYSNGRWGAIAGARFGKTFDKITVAAHAEYLQTFGNHNNEIDIDPALGLSQLGFPDKISVDLKSTHETVAGFDVMYQMNTKWSFGAGFEYIEHYDNGVKGIHSKLKQLPNVEIPGTDITLPMKQQEIVDDLLKETKDMKDGWDEYIIKTSAAYQYTDDVQFAAFFEYTMDEAHSNSQNATDCKMELGVRANILF